MTHGLASETMFGMIEIVKKVLIKQMEAPQ